MDTQHCWETILGMQESLAIVSERMFDKLINLNFSDQSISAVQFSCPLTYCPSLNWAGT